MANKSLSFILFLKESDGFFDGQRQFVVQLLSRFVWWKINTVEANFKSAGSISPKQKDLKLDEKPTMYEPLAAV
jgi:hypothetical protein